MVRVLAWGAFEVLHPGHVHYLEESAELGESLWVTVAPDERTDGSIQAEQSRREMVEALGAVDRAVVESSRGIEYMLSRVEPDIVSLRADADTDAWTAALGRAGLRETEVIQVNPYQPDDEEITTLSGIRARYESQQQP